MARGRWGHATGSPCAFPLGPTRQGLWPGLSTWSSPGGLTPLTASVRAAANVLGYRNHPGVVVLVTDGNETCGGRPCALGAELAATGRNLTVHVIGFRVVDDPFSWNSPEAESYDDGKTVAKCLADRTGGLHVTTETVDELTAALRQTLGCALLSARPRPAGRRAKAFRQKPESQLLVGRFTTAETKSPGHH